MNSHNNKLKVFLCHSSADRTAVRSVYSQLKSEKWIDPWFDEENILPGNDWKLATSEAISSADVIVLFLSKSSVTKEGYVQKELRLALDRALEVPPGEIFLIPVRLGDAPIPYSLRDFQWLDYHNYENSYKKLIKSLQLRALKLNIKQESIKTDYDLDAVYKLLQRLPKNDLQEICFTQFNRRFFANIDWQDYTYKIVNEIVRLAIEQDKVTDILEWVAKNNAKEYRMFKAVSRKTSSDLVLKNKTRKRENPYIPTKPLPEDSNLFLGRLDIARKIANSMKHGNQKPSFLLYGRRRMGKTSALYNLQSLLSDINTISILFSGQSAKLATDIGFCYHLANEVVKKIKSTLFVNQLFDGENEYSDVEAFKTNPVVALESFFDKCFKFLEKNGLYVLIMIDEYEELGNCLSRQLLVQLRDTIQHSRRFVFVFSGASLVDDLPSLAWFEVFVNVTALKISFLGRLDGYKLLTEPISDYSYEDNSLIDEILDLTGCQPFLIQSLAYEIVERLLANNEFVIRKNYVEDAISKVLSSRASYFEGIVWMGECSTNRHKEVLKKISLSKKKVDIVDLDSYRLEIHDLIKKDLLRLEGNYVELCIPLVGLWIKSNIFI